MSDPVTIAEPLLTGRVAVVTGAGRGIGLEVARTLARHGARVMVVDKGTDVGSSASSDASVAASAAEAIREAGGEALHSNADVTDLDSVEDFMSTAESAWGPIDILVNAAGIIRDRMVWNVPEDEWDDVQRVHVKGCFGTTRYLARALRTRENHDKPTIILNFASSAGVYGMQGTSSYGAAKAAIIGFTRIVAMELARYNTRANCIMPYAWTRMAGELPTDGDSSWRAEQIRQLSPEGVANLIVALAASSHPGLTGQTIGLRGHELLLLAQPSIDMRAVITETGAEPLLQMLENAVGPGAGALRASTEVFNYPPL